MTGEVAHELFACIVEQARALKLLSNEHFTVDGTLIQAWASHKSFQPKDGGDDPGSDFRGQTRRTIRINPTDPEAKLSRKGHGQESKLAYWAT